MTSQSIVDQAQEEMEQHLGLGMLENLLQSKINSHQNQCNKLIHKLALLQVSQIKDMFEDGIITSEEVSEMILDYKKVDEILDNI